jgi:hypothetical protein
MKPLGVVLLFINLLVAGAVAYLASWDWAKRQEQNTALLKQELAVSGLPLERPAGNKDAVVDVSKPEESVPLETSPALGRSMKDVRAKVLIDLFVGATREPAADGSGLFASFPTAPPLSVIGEVDAVKKEYDRVVNGYADGAKQAAGLDYLVGRVDANLKLTAGPLTLLADDFEERYTLREWLDEAKKGNAGEYWQLARAALDRRFDEVLNAPDANLAAKVEADKLTARQARDAAQTALIKAKDQDKAKAQADYEAARLAFWKAATAKTAALSNGDRRRKAAALLAVLDQSAGGQKRTALTVGMADYTAAVLDRTQRLANLPARYSGQTQVELGNFEAVYKQKIATAIDLDKLASQQESITKALDASEKRADAQVKLREAHRDAALGRTEDVNKRVSDLAAAQAKLEQDIFALQRLVGANYDELFELEDKVILAEKKKAGK